ncbi:MAG: nucleotidyl transferase AbiEii/AbiGii toxin family protein [Actinobacteria bacterium]|nr:nucleotidyl transferase AbiEii/AbiGii toxin family protein [Actinomycetota bacterium]
MAANRSYGSPAAFRRALTDKLRDIAKSSPWSLPQLQRQIAYDRLLERLYLVDDGWIVKGATALLARDLGVRGTIDVDLYRSAALEVAEAELRQAVTQDIGDWFRFEIGARHTLSGGAEGVRLPVTASIGTTDWCSFRVDIVGPEIRLTGQPEWVPALARVAIPGLEQHGYVVYPLVDHIADKVAAILQTYGTGHVPSTRYKDLVDLVAILSEASVEAEQQYIALRSEADRRGIDLPNAFSVPDRDLWERGYAAEAGRSLLDTALTLDEALAIVTPFLDPLFHDTATGTWDPKGGSWK